MIELSVLIKPVQLLQGQHPVCQLRDQGAGRPHLGLLHALHRPLPEEVAEVRQQGTRDPRNVHSRS